MKNPSVIGVAHVAAAVAAAAGLASSVLAYPTYPTYTPIALSGVTNQYGPTGVAAGVTFANNLTFNATPVINSAGSVAFRSNLSGTGTPDSAWINIGGVNYNIALAGGARPGGGTYPTGTSVMTTPAVNDSGEWFMRVGSQTGAVGTTGGVAGRLAYAGDIAPGTGNATFATSNITTTSPYYNNAGQAAYIATLTTTTGSPAVTTTAPNANNTGLWVGTAGAGMTLMLRQNQTSTLLDSGVGPTGIVQVAGESRIGSFQTSSMAFNNNGSYVVSANLQGANIVTNTGINTMNNGVILTNRSGSLEVIARAGAVAPDATGAPSADLYRGTAASGLDGSQIGFNNAGHVAFVVGLRNNAAVPVTTAASALFTDNNGTLHLVARAGGATPTVYNPDGSVDTGFTGTTWGAISASSPIINANDRIAFISALTGGAAVGNGNSIVQMDTAGRMTSIAQQGEIAVAGGNPLGGDATFSSFGTVQMNAVGQMVFSGTLTNTPDGGIFGGPGGNNSIIMGWDQTLGLMPIARTGDLFTVAPGDVRTISAIGGNTTTGGQDGRLIGLNNSGQYALTLYFTNGTDGIFLVTIPTPGAAGLLCLAGLTAMRRRR